jgi:hypothetical protein
MKTQEKYAEQCRTENAEMIETTNGVTRKLSKAEYDAAVEAWALMRWYQDNPDQQPAPTPTPLA